MDIRQAYTTQISRLNDSATKSYGAVRELFEDAAVETEFALEQAAMLLQALLDEAECHNQILEDKQKALNWKRDRINQIGSRIDEYLGREPSSTTEALINSDLNDAQLTALSGEAAVLTMNLQEQTRDRRLDAFRGLVKSLTDDVLEPDYSKIRVEALTSAIEVGVSLLPIAGPIVEILKRLHDLGNFNAKRVRDASEVVAEVERYIAGVQAWSLAADAAIARLKSDVEICE